jgi:hypothetical protein
MKPQDVKVGMYIQRGSSQIMRVKKITQDYGPWTGKYMWTFHGPYGYIITAYAGDTINRRLG